MVTINLVPMRLEMLVHEARQLGWNFRDDDPSYPPHDRIKKTVEEFVSRRVASPLPPDVAVVFSNCFCVSGSRILIETFAPFEEVISRIHEFAPRFAPNLE